MLLDLVVVKQHIDNTKRNNYQETKLSAYEQNVQWTNIIVKYMKVTIVFMTRGCRFNLTSVSLQSLNFFELETSSTYLVICTAFPLLSL